MSELPIATFLDRLKDNFPIRTVGLESPMVMDGESKYIEVDISAKIHPKVELIHLTDLQIGGQVVQPETLSDLPGLDSVRSGSLRGARRRHYRRGDDPLRGLAV